MSSGVENLYKNFGLLADAKEKDIAQHVSAYEGLIQAAKGSAGEKKLAPSFITKFFRYFPSLHDTATDAILDLIEDEDPHIRRLAIKSLPDICNGASDDTLYVKVSDVLTQLLPIEDSTDLTFVKTSMATVLQMNTKLALEGIFDQIMGEDETIRQKGFEYICGTLMSMKSKLFDSHPENEEVLFNLVKKVLVDVTGEEFEMLMELLGQLSCVSTPDGSQQLSSLISQQAELSAEFKPHDTEFMDKFITCFRHALKLRKCASIASPFIEYMCLHAFPLFEQVKEDQIRQEMLQLLAESCDGLVEKKVADSCIHPTFDHLLTYMPQPPDSNEEQPKLHFSTVECVLFVFHKFCKLAPEFLSSDEGRLKTLRVRLQFFARGSQAYHAQLRTTGKETSGATDTLDEQNKLRNVALKTTANITTLIKDFFHNPPSYRTTVTLSWIVKCATELQRKRSSSGQDMPAKRKPSPIRFDSSSARGAARKEPVTLYSPPKDKFSKKIAEGSNFEDYALKTKRSGKRSGWIKK